MKLNEYEFPDGLKYNDDYSWVKVDKDEATVGVSDFGAKRVKQFVFIELPKEGSEINKDAVYVSLEAIKWSGHLKSPVSGKIIEVNPKLSDSPEIINKSPYGEGWIMKVRLDNNKELEKLMNSKEAVEWAKKKLNQ